MHRSPRCVLMEKAAGVPGRRPRQPLRDERDISDRESWGSVWNTNGERLSRKKKKNGERRIRSFRAKVVQNLWENYILVEDTVLPKAMSQLLKGGRLRFTRMSLICFRSNKVFFLIFWLQTYVTSFYHLPRQFHSKGTLFYGHDVYYTLISRDK
jgi:hypothetical protein